MLNDPLMELWIGLIIVGALICAVVYAMEYDDNSSCCTTCGVPMPEVDGKVCEECAELRRWIGE